MRNKGKKLRKGITTGTTAAAATRAAADALFAAIVGGGAVRKAPARPGYVTVPLPRGSSVRVKVRSVESGTGYARASVVKYAGDDPDVTNGATIISEVALAGMNESRTGVAIRGGVGVGTVTRPGLKVGVGHPAINPTPRSMIRRAVIDSAKEAGITPSVVVTISVPRGVELATRTMNARLGITGGISILGTTGIVEPMSLSAYTQSIGCAVDVAVASSLSEVVFSTGRSSERVVELARDLPEVAYVLTGDHMGYAMDCASKKPDLRRITIAGQFGKFTKLASNHFETHCADSTVELGFLADLAVEAGADDALAKRIRGANTAREVFFILREEGLESVFGRVAELVRANAIERLKAAGRLDLEVSAVLVGYSGEIVVEVGPRGKRKKQGK